VAECRFSRLAEADLLEIATYTLQTWGEDQAIRYIDNLKASASNSPISRA